MQKMVTFLTCDMVYSHLNKYLRPALSTITHSLGELVDNLSGVGQTYVFGIGKSRLLIR